MVQEIEMMEELIKPIRVWHPRGKSVSSKLMDHLLFYHDEAADTNTMHRVFCAENGGFRVLAKWGTSKDTLGGIL
jgi:hypothetical protein